jgi:Papain family cysteine protease/Domain of unknown function (DUF4384)
MIKNGYLIFALCATQTVCAQQKFATGLDFDDAAYAKTPVKKRELSRSYEKLPLKSDLKPFCPTPQQQGDFGTCVGWAVGYAACTISEGVAKNIQNKNILNEIASSPTYIYAFGKSEKDVQCKRGAKIDDALTKLKNVVVPRHQNFKEMCTPLDKLPKNISDGLKINDFTKLFKDSDDWKQKLEQLKKSLSDKKPIVIGIMCFKSLTQAKKVWSGKQDEYMGGHAVCVMGYDDTFEGGAVEIMNSWGDNWGEKGFTMIRYSDFEAILKYAYELKTDVNAPANNAPTFKETTFASKILLKSAADGATMPVEAVQNEVTKLTRGSKVVKDEVSQYKTVQSYRSGTKYRLFIDLTEPTYLYVLSADLTGQISKLFPADETMSAYISNPNARIALPDEKWSIELDQTKGKDYTFLLYSKEAQPIDQLLTQWNAQRGAAITKISKTFSDKMQPSNVLNLDKKQMSFRTTLDSKNIILLTLEMEHL